MHVFDYVYIYVCVKLWIYFWKIIRLCVYVRMHMCMHILVYVCTYICTYVCMYVFMYICMYACTYVIMFVCVYVYICVFKYVFICIFMYVCISDFKQYPYDLSTISKKVLRLFFKLCSQRNILFLFLYLRTAWAYFPGIPVDVQCYLLCYRIVYLWSLSFSSTYINAFSS